MERSDGDTVLPPTVGIAETQAQLEKILESQRFAPSPLLKKFLKFVVTKSLNGRGADLSEFQIALEVFGKPESFDTSQSSTVRTAANRLRAELRKYYEDEGKHDAVIISIPKGHYVPKVFFKSFDSRGEDEAQELARNGWWGGEATVVGRDQEIRQRAPEVMAPTERTVNNSIANALPLYDNASRYEMLLRQVLRPWLSFTILGIALALFFAAIFDANVSQRHLLPQMAQLTIDGRAKRGPLVLEGNRLWFQEMVQDGWKLASVAATGGETQTANLPFKETYLLGAAGGGSALLLESVDGSEKKTWVWSTGGGNLQLLRPEASTEAIESPDRQTTALRDGNTVVFARGGRVIKRVAMPPGSYASRIQWAPDSSHISFVSANMKLSLMNLFLADTLTGNAWPMAQTGIVGEDQTFGAWTKDGRYFMFSAGSPEIHDLWAVEGPERARQPDRIPPLRITNGPMNWVEPISGNTTGEIYALGESRRRELVSLKPGTDSWRPYLNGIPGYELDFSRDGERVAYIHYPDHRLWIARVDGTERFELAWPSFEAHQPHWSPDGTRIAFMGKPRDKWRVMIVDAATDRGVEPVPDGEDQGVPTWTRDGRLVFGDWPTGDPQQVMKLHLLDLGQRQVGVLPASEGLWSVRCSPDGNYLAAFRQGSKALVVSRWGSSEWQEILSGEGMDDLVWAGDSKHLHLMRSRQLVRVDVLNRRMEKIVDVHDFPFTHEQWFGLTPDGSLLGLRGALGQEIYSLQWQP
jgi:Tol biopolymer transport system component